VWNWLHIVLLAPRILRCLLDFWRACGPLFELNEFTGKNQNFEVI
jgi:hypothetical protein